VERAKVYAVIVHDKQMYSLDRPYLYHLERVALTLARFGYDFEDLQTAAYLHDTLEDTDATREEIVALFGCTVYDMVYRVTNEPGNNRRERHEKTYPKMHGDHSAIALKLADRIANVEDCILTNDKRFKMYYDEHTAFRNALYDGAHYMMWKWLDLLFR
jgi:(p)ppGpp synthase/HD superfamily hydrolase